MEGLFAVIIISYGYIEGGFLRKEWMIYGAPTISGKKLLTEALRLGHSPILASGQGQELTDLAIQTHLESRIFPLSEKEVDLRFLADVKAVILCEDLEKREHLRLLYACLDAGVHYFDTTNDLFSFERVQSFAVKFHLAGLSLAPGLHPSVILSDFVAATLKSQLTDAISLQLACSESFSSVSSLMGSIFSGGRILQDGKLKRPHRAADSVLVPFNGSQSLSVSAPHADMLSAWLSTRIPNITVFRKSGAREVRFLKIFRFFRWLLHVPLVKKWLKKQENFLLRHFAIKPFYPERYSVWGRASNFKGRSITVRIEVVEDFDVALDVTFRLLNILFSGELFSGIVTPSQVFGSDYWAESKRLAIEPLP